MFLQKSFSTAVGRSLGVWEAAAYKALYELRSDKDKVMDENMHNRLYDNRFPSNIDSRSVGHIFIGTIDGKDLEEILEDYCFLVWKLGGYSNTKDIIVYVCR